MRTRAEENFRGNAGESASVRDTRESALRMCDTVRRGGGIERCTRARYTHKHIHSHKYIHIHKYPNEVFYCVFYTETTLKNG